MHLVIRSTAQQKSELLYKGFGDVYVDWIDEHESLQNNADAFFDLTFNDEQINTNIFFENKIVFVNAVNCTCNEIDRTNYVRINAWPGFLNNSIIESASLNEETKAIAATIFNALNWQFVWAPDDYGFISARIIAMIINEAFYALQENISTQQQIDLAMKLGTNYPFGPFEWTNKIGADKIFRLLKKLSINNSRYTIATLLEQQALKK